MLSPGASHQTQTGHLYAWGVPGGSAPPARRRATANPQVIEELKQADHALTRLLAMRAGRLPQGTAQQSPELGAGRTLA